MTGGRSARILAAAMAGAALLAIAASPATAAVKPSLGVYSAEPKKLATGYQEGLFALVNDGGRKRIVAYESAAGIYYPDAGKCDDEQIPLATDSIPVSAKGRFKHRERIQVKRGSLLVVWKGAWKKPRRVEGTVRIKYGKCDSKFGWVGRRTKPAIRP
jgi:hypothetical protein